jgi:cytochrome c553
MSGGCGSDRAPAPVDLHDDRRVRWGMIAGGCAIPRDDRRMRRAISITVLLWAVATLPWAQGLPLPDDMAQRVRACTACHGKEGRASSEGYLPRIAGKPAGYLFNQLLNFRDGRRANTAMQRLIDPLNENYLHEIAAYFAALDLPYPPPQVVSMPAAMRERAQRLVNEGDSAREVPACARCHGKALAGAQPAVPGLLGLPRDYLVAQLGAWRGGLRRAHTPDCMATIARRLDNDDVVAVATWLAAQTPSSSGAPHDTIDPSSMPMECGLRDSPSGKGSKP